MAINHADASLGICSSCWHGLIGIWSLSCQADHGASSRQLGRMGARHVNGLIVYGNWHRRSAAHARLWRRKLVRLMGHALNRFGFYQSEHLQCSALKDADGCPVGRPTATEPCAGCRNRMTQRHVQLDPSSGYTYSGPPIRSALRPEYAFAGRWQIPQLGMHLGKFKISQWQ